MIQVNGLSKHYGSQVVFDDVSFNLSPRERIGLVGRNGAGKSTLFRILLGHEAPDSGEVKIPKGYKLGALEQHINFQQKTVLDECCLSLSEEEKYNTYKAEKILFGLGFTQEDLEKDPKSFSGGYQVRINLCKALLTEPNLLLLDEPTNYLDIVSLRWLKNFLNNFPGEVIIITHDRDFMDGVVTHVMGISRNTLRKIKGDTAKYYEQIVMEEEIHEQTRLNQERKKQELMKFVDKFRAKASKAAQAQSRLKQIEKMDTIDALAVEKSLDFSFHYKDTPAKVLMEVEDLSFSYSRNKDELLFRDLNFHVGKNDRIGIIGKNGKGKSTLLNVLNNELEAFSGSIQKHQATIVGHFGQTNIKRLHDDNTIVSEVQEVNPDLSSTQVRNICGTMMFEGDLADKKVRVLSGGEKSRVMLGKILAGPANLLFLDEPTNHLDMESIAALGESIVDFEGAVLIVTHSEALLRKICNKLVIFHEGTAEYFDGTYDEFLEKIGWESEEVSESRKKPKKSKKEIQKLRQEIIQEKSKTLGPINTKVEELENNITVLENFLELKNKEMLTASTEGNGTKINELGLEIAKINEKVESLFFELEELSEELEAKNNDYEKRLIEIEN